MTSRERKRPAHLDVDMEDKEFIKAVRAWDRQKGQPPAKKKQSAEPDKDSIPEVAKQPIQIVKSKGVRGKPKGDHSQTPALTPQARLQEEIEEKHIARSRDRKIRSTKTIKVLPEGAVEIADIKTAVKRGVKECSTSLLDWTDAKAKMIGGLCKVYWDGENTWFYARILNYDSHYDRHYIYYLEDSTAEWISLENEIVLVAEEMVLARLNPGGAPWAAQRFWISEKAKTVCHNFPGFHKGGEYVEYMTEQKHKEYAFLQRKCLDPMQDKFMPRKPSAAFKKGMKAAELEQMDIDEVRDLVKQATRDSVFGALSGEQWVGHRVRASTHRIVQRGESRTEVLEQGSAYSAGKVVLFQPSSGEHFVVFDDPLLQPQWVVCQKSAIDVLLGEDEAAPVANEEEADGSSGAKKKAAVVVKKWPHLHHNNVNTVNPVDYSEQCACVLCQGELVRGDHKRCEKCGLRCHTYCLPEEADAVAQPWATNANLPWTCWNCVVCFGCDEPSWNKSLLAWNAQRVEPEGPDLEMSVCGDCLYRYKYVKDFCPACFKPYATDDSMLPLLGPVVVVPDAPVAVGANTIVHAEGTGIEDAKTGVSAGAETEVETEAAVMMCGDCVEPAVTAATKVLDDSSSTAMEAETDNVSTMDTDKEEATTITASTTALVTASGTVSDAPASNDASQSGSSSTSDANVSAKVGGKVEADSNELSEDNMVECNECSRWVHAHCEGIDKTQYDAMTLGTHPVWGDEYLCPLCRVKLSKQLIHKMSLQDQYGMFAEPVTEKVARNYYDVIRNPMDLATMSSKAKRGLYKSLQALRQDFELMCLNAMVFNTTGDEYWREARRYHEEVQSMFRLQKRKSHGSAYGFELAQLIESYNASLEAAKASKSKAGQNKRKTPAASTTASASSVRSDETGQTGEENGATGDAASSGMNGFSSSSGPKRTKFATEAGSGRRGQSDAASESTTDAGDASPRPPTGSSSNGTHNAPVGTSSSKGKVVAVPSAVAPPPEDNLFLDESVYLPVQLVPSPDPSTFLPCTVVSQSVEESFFLMCQDACLVCGAAGKSEVMLFCVDCGEAVHTFCSDAPLSLMSAEARAGWRCMNCKFCQGCNTSTENESVGKMLYCEGCDAAFHSLCLSPRLEATPETSWYCAECVKCSTCSVSVETTLSKCWGFDLACCYNCTLVEQARRAAEEAEEHKRQLELLRRQDPAVCNICWTSCTVPYVMCSACGRNSHVACNSTNAMPVLKNGYEAYRDFLCLACSTEHMPSCVSHLGTGPQAAALLSLVARIQRTRKEHALQAQDRQMKACEAERIALFENHRRLFRTVIHLATLRMQWFATFSGANGTQQGAPRPPSPPSLLVSSRALRFLAIWRRRGGDTDAGVAQRQRYLGQGLDVNGQEMSAERLVRIAALASAYLVSTTADVRRFVSREVEIAPAVQFILRLHQESHGASLSASDVAAIAAAGSIQFMGFETSLNGVTGDASSSSNPTPPTFAAPNANAVSSLSVLPDPAAVAASASATMAGTVALVKLETPPTPSLSPLFELIEGCIEKLLRIPIGLGSTDVPLHYVAGTQVFGTDKRRTEVVVPWKPGNVIQSTLLSRPVPPIPPPVAPAGSAAHGAALGKMGPTGMPQFANLAQMASRASAQPLHSDVITVDLCHGEGFYARKARLCGLVPRAPVAPHPAENLQQLLERRDVQAVASALDKVRHVPQKEDPALAARLMQEQLRAEKYGPDYSMVKAALEDIIARIERKSKRLTPAAPVAAAAPAPTPLIDIDNHAEVKLCLPCESFNPDDYTFVATPAKAMAGWGNDALERPWTDPRNCCLCLDSREDSVVGRLMPSFDGLFTHVNCLRWSPDVVESEGSLQNAIAGRERALKTSCFYCTRKGASVCCNKRKCRRAFHVRCAIACKCLLLETKPLGFTAGKAHDIQLLGLCTEHIPVIRDLPGYTRRWHPYDPLRPMLVAENHDANFTPELLAQRRSDKAVRAGALTVYSLGKPLASKPHFFDKDYIYPHRFRSTRIYWSMVAPFRRTLYTFEIFSESDFDQLESSKVDYIRAQLERNDRALRRQSKNSSNDDDWDAGDKPIFRIVAMDNTASPIFSHSVEQAFQMVAQGVFDVNRAHNTAFARCTLNRPRTSDSFGFTAHQFCGLGLPFVRKAIELLPESLGMMVSLNREEARTLYAPVFRLPTKENVVQLQQQLLRAQEGATTSVNGCARADGFGQSEKRFVGKRITRILSKVADVGETAGRAKTELNQYELREDEDENKRVNEALKSRYREMTAAYLHNPYAKLDVRKSGIHGWGLFAKINFERNDIIVEYIGQKIRQVVADRREAQYEDEGVGSCYLFRLDKEDIIDATRRGGMARFMNHCCEPNAYARVIITTSPSPSGSTNSASSSTEPASVVEEKHIIIIAARDIQEGEEVTYDYKFPIEDSKLKCYCGASCCGGFMN